MKYYSTKIKHLGNLNTVVKFVFILENVEGKSKLNIFAAEKVLNK
jgi:hypothetical protein